MSQINNLHDQAMAYIDEAFLAERRGDQAGAHEHYRKALKLEIEAAELLRDELTIEPSRSVLYRSAASIAMSCGQYREAERLIAVGLAGKPPSEIAEELRTLLEQVRAEQHLAGGAASPGN